MGGLLAAGCTAAAGRAPTIAPPSMAGGDTRSRCSQDFARQIDKVEADVGGRIGVYAVDTGSADGPCEVGYRENERFAMCSTFKWVLAAAVLQRVDRGESRLGDRVGFGLDDLLEYAPFAKEHVAEGSATVVDLARAAVVVSDNTAANLLLAGVGGPKGLTAFVRAQGDVDTRLDRVEPFLNENAVGDVRDTTTPRAMVRLMRRVLLGGVLSMASTAALLGWLRECETGVDRLRAGIPTDWVVGDKTGSGMGGACNDVAIAVPPRRAPILMAVYMTGSNALGAQMNAAHARVASAIVAASGG